VCVCSPGFVFGLAGQHGTWASGDLHGYLAVRCCFVFCFCFLWLGIAATLQRAGFFCLLFFYVLAGFALRMSDDIAWHRDELFVCIWTERDARGLVLRGLLAKYKYT
jgi:hypothetical protein